MKFPAQGSCPRCGGEATTPIPLARTGTLWTWTRQRFQPKNPPYIGREPAAEFEPYGVGYSQLYGAPGTAGVSIVST